MRTIFRILLIAPITLCMIAAVGFYWLNYYSRDLPDISQLAQMAPSQPGKAMIGCTPTKTSVIPYSEIGKNVLAAVSVAEINRRPNDPNNLPPVFIFQIARQLYCQPDRALHRGMSEMRLAIHLNRRYSHEELVAIYLNEVPFGDDLYGVSDAAQHFFRKSPNQLSIAEAALLAGLIPAPQRYSPIEHPDRALTRRNEVIDAMFASGEISAMDATAAKGSSLLPVQ